MKCFWGEITPTQQHRGLGGSALRGCARASAFVSAAGVFMEIDACGHRLKREMSAALGQENCL